MPRRCTSEVTRPAASWPGRVADTEREWERDLDRFLTFVDAVVAIAITLLVLPLAERRPDRPDRLGGPA